MFGLDGAAFRIVFAKVTLALPEVPSTEIAPKAAALLFKVQFVTCKLATPPADVVWTAAPRLPVLSVKVQLVSFTVALPLKPVLKIVPPKLPVFAVRVQLDSVMVEIPPLVPPLQMAPPLVAVLPVSTQLLSVSVARSLRTAPPFNGDGGGALPLLKVRPLMVTVGPLLVPFVTVKMR